MKTQFPYSHKRNDVALATVSGAASTKPSLIRYFDKKVDCISIITTKSYQIRPNSGNREPVIVEDEIGCFGNSVGLRNPGMDEAIKEIKALREEGINKWLNVSLSADNESDFITLVKAFSPYADSVELNFSCPHAKKGYGASIGSDKDIAASYTKAIDEATKDRECLLFIKLTPNVDNIGEIAKAVVDSGADGITAINTVGPVSHMEPISGKEVLNNPLGGKGGKSGDDIFPIALNALKAIRASIGDDIPIIAMGGVSDGERAAKLIKNGADCVGIGSALARVNQKKWPEYLSLIKREAIDYLKGEKPKLQSRSLLSGKKVMEYREHIVTTITRHSDDTIIFTLDGECPDFKAGMFVFLWLPEVGEKPFSLARISPLTFIIKRRGIFTSSLIEKIKVGMKIFLRGPYGGEVEIPKTKKALLILGGTGEAVAEPLSLLLEKNGTEISYLVGTSEEGNRGIMEDVLSPMGSYKCVSDNSKIARVLDYIPSTISSLLENTSKDDIAFYLIGPEIFMKRASSILLEEGFAANKILLSMEKNSMCGVGLCGECASGERLSCQWGTFFTLEFLQEEKVL